MATRPVEDIEAVLGRFQAWAGARNAAEVTGIREISYDEALGSDRYRWKGARAAASKKAGRKTGGVAEPLKASTAPATAELDKKQAAKPVRREQARVRNHGNAAGGTKASAGVKVAAESKSSGGGNHCAAEKLASHRGSADAKPEFREALAAAVCPTEVVVAQPAALTRQSAISIRLAPSERTLIQTRAAEAGITASAYIRQCALEVEQLRAQVQAAVALMGSRNGIAAAAASPVSESAPLAHPPVGPGFFARIRRRLFPSRVPALALRA